GRVADLLRAAAVIGPVGGRRGREGEKSQQRDGPAHTGFYPVPRRIATAVRVFGTRTGTGSGVWHPAVRVSDTGSDRDQQSRQRTSAKMSASRSGVSRA